MTLKLPPFWPQDPELWFTQVEAQFTTRNITGDATKHAYLIAALTPEVAAEVRELLMSPPEADKYKNLKDELISRTTKSMQTRIKQLLTSEELDGRKPTQLLRRMKQLIGTNTALVPDALLKQIFIPRLPATVQMMIAANENLTLDKTAELADKLMDTIGPQIAATSSSTASSSMDDIGSLRREINEIKTLLRGRQADKSGSSSRTRSKTPARKDDEPAGACWFHLKFGDKAKKCRTGCTYNPGNGSGSH